MAAVLPFCATRYQQNIPLGDVTAPPYDVLNPVFTQELRERSPYNAVYLSKNPSSDPEKPYAHIPDILKSWHQQNIIQRDTAPVYYYAEDSFSFEGVEKTRKGIFALIEVQSGKTQVIPHEYTIKAHIQDRLKLMDRTNAFLSPIFLIGDDPNQELYSILSNLSIKGSQTFKRIDQAGEQTFGIIDDLSTQQTIQSYFDNNDLLIADGHHRYETALAYAKTHNKPAFVLAFISSSADPGLVLSSIHRAVSTQIPPAQWIENKLSNFQVQPLSKQAFDQSEAPFAMLDYSNEKMYLYKQPTTKAPTEVFQQNILENEMNIDLRTPEGQAKMRFFKHDHALKQHCLEQQAIGFWLKPMSIQGVFDVCKAGDVLPQKSTYFYPKVLDGLVYHELKS